LIAAASTPPDAFALFARAQRAFRAAAYPRTLQYVIHVTVIDGSKLRDAHYKAQCNTFTQRIVVDPVSDEEHTNPHVPQGMTVRVHIGTNVPIGHPDVAVDYLGVPRLAPTYDFDIADFEQRDYAMTVDGIERVEGRPAYHLILRPARLSYKLRLREAWIDQKTMSLMRIRTYGNFTSWPFIMTHWTVSFSTLHGLPYIARETTVETLRVEDHVYAGGRVEFEGVKAAPMVDPPLASFTARRILQEPDW